MAIVLAIISLIFLKRSVSDLIKRSYNFDKNPTFENILSQLRKKGDVNSFYGFMQNYINKPPEKLEVNTLKKYRTTLTHLKKFRRQVYFSDIDNLFIQDFYGYMQTDLSLEGAACMKYREALKKVIRQGRKENYIDPFQLEFLFDDVKIKVPKANEFSYLMGIFFIMEAN